MQEEPATAGLNALLISRRAVLFSSVIGALFTYSFWAYYAPNEPFTRVAASRVEPAEGVAASPASAAASSEVQPKRRPRRTHHRVHGSPIANAEVNAPEPNTNGGAPALSDWDLRQKAWCEQVLKIYESNPDFYGPGPLDELRANHCDWLIQLSSSSEPTPGSAETPVVPAPVVSATAQPGSEVSQQQGFEQSSSPTSEPSGPDPDSYKQGYQDGLSAAAPKAGPRNGNSLTDYYDGYTQGYYQWVATKIMPLNKRTTSPLSRHRTALVSSHRVFSRASL
jgi:hypothetical protein